VRPFYADLIALTTEASRIPAVRHRIRCGRGRWAAQSAEQPVYQRAMAGMPCTTIATRSSSMPC